MRRGWFWVILVGLAACRQSNDLEQKKAELRALRRKIARLEAQAAVLEKAIVESDTTQTEVAQKVQVWYPKWQPFTYTIRLQGEVQSQNTLLLSAEVPGSLLRLYVREGQWVKKGTLLAQIEDSQLRHTIQEVEASLALARTLYEKQKRLWEQRIGTEIQYLQAKNQWERLQQRLKALRSQWQKTRIYAPISGFIDEIFVKQGESVFPGMPIIRLASHGNYKVSVQVPENYLNEVKYGDTIEVFIPDLDIRLNTRITAIDYTIDPLSRTFEVEARLPNLKALRSKMSVYVWIKTYRNARAIVLPRHLLRYDDQGRPYVFIAVEEGGKWRAKKRYVSLGKQLPTKVEIKDGLTPKDAVIIRGYQDLAEGATLQVVQSA